MDDAPPARAIERVDPSVPLGGALELEPAAAPRIDIGKLPYYNGFPYLATRLASAVYHIRVLPAEWPRDAQWYFALRQAGANGLPVCLVRDADPGEYFDPETGRTQCGEWRGECLDTLVREMPWVVRVHCRCENRNRCAGCSRLLAERKLNSNQYSEADVKIWHYGGVAALGHRCPS